MSTIVSRQVQVGTSGTATDNFTIRQPATPDGTVRIANGNSGTTNDLVTLTSAGNVGIGTSSPATKLDVNGSGTNVVTSRNSGTANTDSAQFQCVSGSVILQSYAYSFGAEAVVGTVTNHPLAFRTNSTERMRITSSGLVGIGTNNPVAPLSILAAATDSGCLSLTSNAPNGPGGQIAQINSNSAGRAKYIRVITNNNWQIVNAAYSAVILDLTDAGAAFQGNNSSTWSTSSDIRIKTNVRQIGGALDKMMSLKPCHFEYKNAVGETVTGFIAQEFEQVFPGHVKEQTAPMQFEQFIEGEDKNIKTIDANLVPYLVKAIQEQQALITALTDRITALESK